MQDTIRNIFWIGLISLFIWTGCKEPLEVFTPKGDDGQVFGIDTEDSKVPYSGFFN